MLRTDVRWLPIAVLAACSSPSTPLESSRSGGAQPARADAALPRLPLEPLDIGDAPVLEISVTGVEMLTAADPEASLVFSFARGEARTRDGRFEVLWKRDELLGVPVAGPGMRANRGGSWRAEIVGELGASALRVRRGDDGRVVASSAEPMRVVGAIEDGRFRIVVFSRGPKLRIARATDDHGVRWKVADLPAPSTALALTDPDGRIDVAWSTDAGIRWLHLEPEHAEGRLPAPESQPGAGIVASCANQKLWIATDASLQRVGIEPIDVAKPSSIVACDYHSAIVRLEDGSSQLCSDNNPCEPLAIPAEATVAFVDDEPIAASHEGGVLSIWRGGEPSRFGIDGDVTRLALFDLGGTPVIVVFDTDGKSTRWAKLGSALSPAR
jgi:hypothetical protein